MKNESGFSLLELVISLSLIAVLAGAASMSFGPWLDFRQKMITDARLKLFQIVLNKAYTDNVGVAEWSDAGLALGAEMGAGVIRVVDADVLVSAQDLNGCETENFTLAQAKQKWPVLYKLSAEADSLYADGFNRPVCILVSSQMSLPAPTDYESGVDATSPVFTSTTANIPFHRIAVVSAGVNGFFESIWNATEGRLDPAGDDQAIVVDGYIIQAGIYAETWKKVLGVARAYGKYFNTHYKLNASRDIMTNYFYGDKSITPDGDLEYVDQDGLYNPDRNSDMPMLSATSGSVQIGTATAPAGQDLKYTSDENPSINAQFAMEALGLSENDTRIPGGPALHPYIRMYNIDVSKGYGVSGNKNAFIRHPDNQYATATGGGADCSLATDSECRSFPIYSVMIQADVPGTGGKSRTVQFIVPGIM